MLLVTGMFHHTEDTLSMFSQHPHAFTSPHPIILPLSVVHCIWHYLLTMQKTNPTKSNCPLFFRIPAVFHLHWITLYDGCTLTPTAWSRDNPEGDSYTPPDLARWIWMAVSVQVPLQRREILLWGPKTRTVAGHCEQGHPAAWCLFSASADMMQDMNVHHTMESWFVKGPSTPMRLRTSYGMSHWGGSVQWEGGQAHFWAGAKSKTRFFSFFRKLTWEQTE